MAQIETWYRQDLNKPVKVHYLDGNVFSQDNQGNIIGVEVFDGETPASLSGSVGATIVRSDGYTVSAVGTLSNNKVSVALPQAAYAVPGAISIVLKLTTGSVITTLCAVVAIVYPSETSTIVDPGTIIPSINTLIAEIQSAVASIPADYSELWKSLAPNFSTSKPYYAYQYVTYDGGLYQFKTDHAAGTWDSSHVKKIDIGFGVAEIKNALCGSGFFPVTVEHGSITTAGVEQNDDQRLRTGLIDVSDVNYISVIVQSGFRIAILFYNSDGSYAGSTSDWGNITSTNKNYNVSSRSKIRCVIIKDNPASGYVMPYSAAQNNFVIVPKAVNNFIASTETHYLERDSDGIYIRWTNNIWLRGSLNKALPTTDNSGLTLVDSPLGIDDCVYIENNKSLVYNTADQSMSVIDTDTLHENTTIIPLLSVITMLYHKGKAKGLLCEVFADAERTFLAENEFMSLTYQYEPYFEYSGTIGVYFNLNGGAGYLRGYVTGRNWNDMQSIPLADGITLTTSPMGQTECLFIPHNYSFIWVPFVNKYYLVPNAEMWKYPYSVLIYQVIGNKGHDVITNGIGNRGVKYINDAEGITVDSGNVFFDYNSSFKTVGEKTEPFMFFSDPHVMGTSNKLNSSNLAGFVNALRFGYENTPTGFIVDGGDWLNVHDYQTFACYKLGLIDGLMRKNFVDYYPMDGNHDTNYQGYISADDTTSRGDLPIDTMIALHWKQNGAIYYEFDGIYSKNYVFDTGVEWDTAMDAYRWQQIDWFANRLIADDPENAVVWQHVAFTDFTTHDPTQFSLFAQNIGQVISAYNSRSSVTLNGVTYNFTGKTGKVRAVMCGHTHADMQGVLGGVPVVSVTKAYDDGVVSYDLGYFDFDNSVLKLFRIGSGSNRTINI